MPPKKKEAPDEGLTRIAIVNKDKCKPKKCRQVCKTSDVLCGRQLVHTRPCLNLRGLVLVGVQEALSGGQAGKDVY